MLESLTEMTARAKKLNLIRILLRFGRLSSFCSKVNCELRTTNYELTIRLIGRIGTLFLLLVIFFPIPAPAATGISNYEKGDFEGALQDFEGRLKSGNTTAEIRFDAGAAAYKKGDYKKAVGYFTSAMTAPSPKIQQAATYNLANALVRQGELATESSEKISDWKNAIQHYETVLKSDPKNKEAQENRDLVKKLIEDLKNQQEQQKKNQKQDKNQNQQKDQQNQQKDQQNQQKDQQNQQNQQQQQKDQQKDQKKDQDQSSSGNDSGKPDQKPNEKPEEKPNQKSDSSKESNPSQSPDNQKNPSPSSDQQKKGEATPTPTPTPSPSSGSGAGANSSPTPTATPSPSAAPKSGSGAGPNPTPSPSAAPSSTPSSEGKGDQSSQQQPSNQQPTPQPVPSSQGAASGNQTPSQQGKAPQPMSSPQSSPGEKKEGKLSGGQKGEDANAESASAAEEGPNGMMSAKQAEALLRSMQGEEEEVKIKQRHETEETTKDW